MIAALHKLREKHLKTSKPLRKTSNAQGKTRIQPRIHKKSQERGSIDPLYAKERGRAIRACKKLGIFEEERDFQKLN